MLDLVNNHSSLIHLKLLLCHKIITTVTSLMQIQNKRIEIKLYINNYYNDLTQSGSHLGRRRDQEINYSVISDSDE